jgi:hypothetical protein
MTADNQPGKPIRKIIPITLMLLILGIFFSIYFFKYVPDQQHVLNNRGFLELQQIQNALQDKETGYEKAIRVSLQNTKAYSRLLSNFTVTPYWPPPECTKGGPSRQIGGTAIMREIEKNTVQLTYPLICKSAKPGADLTHDSIFYMSIGIEKVLAPIISTYRDIFDNYLLILDSADTSGIYQPEHYSKPHRGEILYNSGNLPIDYPVDMDSLIRTRDGFSLLNIHNVTVEGNAYKLFLYPLQVGNERMVLAGLMSLSQYNEGVRNIPFALIALPGIIILLLLIHLPVLKIYLIGMYERVTDMDIRLLIGTYFIAAFAAFFLFSWLFLAKVQVANNHKNLGVLSAKIQEAFHAEIDSMCLQLVHTDSIYAGYIGPKMEMLDIMRHGPANKKDTQHNFHLDTLFRSLTYPYPDNIFLVDSTAKLVATWNALIQKGSPNLFSLKDRQYFKDFRNGYSLRDTLHRSSDPAHPRPDTIIPFNIQPVLSKLDGEYAINLVIKCARSRIAFHDSLPPKNKGGTKQDTLLRPWLIGISAKMHSVTNTQLPVGYNFSIIDENGNVLYDSKLGRALLSNFLNGSDDPAGIRACAVYRNRRFFDQTMLNGRKTALLANPIGGMPYTLLTYYNLENQDEFEFHLIGLSSLFTGAIILLILFSALINEWTRKKTGLILSPANHFEWLQPAPEKKRYYRLLIRGMFLLLGVYLLGWLLVEQISGESDFSLFFITLLFPFNIALCYYSLRQTYYRASLKKNQAAGNNSERIGGVTFFLVTLLLLVGLFYFLGESSFSGHSAVLLLIQALWWAAIQWVRRRFRESATTTRSPGTTNSQGIAAWFKKWTGYLNYYSLAIVCGVCMISLIPACGIFWLLYRQETTLRLNSERLETIRAADTRRGLINNVMADHKFFVLDSSCSLDNGPCRNLKFQHGLYLIHEDFLQPDGPAQDHESPPGSLSLHYIRWHQLFFPEDSSVMAWTEIPLSAGDGSWTFWARKAPGPGTELDYSTQKDGLDKEPFQLHLGPEAPRSTFSLLCSETGATSTAFILLFFGSQAMSVLLSLILTHSLARRIFLANLINQTEETDQPDQPGQKPAADKTTAPAVQDGPAVQEAPGTQQKDPDPAQQELRILENLIRDEDLYDDKWEKLKPMEKFILYDFAKDGFTNYRTIWFIYKLKHQGFLEFRKDGLQFTDPSFREYVLQQSGNKDVQSFLKVARQTGSWQSFKIPLMILFATFGLFVFFTQDALYQKITGLAASFISMRPLLLSLFEKGNNDKADNDGGSKDAS